MIGSFSNSSFGEYNALLPVTDFLLVSLLPHLLPVFWIQRPELLFSRASFRLSLQCLRLGFPSTTLKKQVLQVASPVFCDLTPGNLCSFISLHSVLDSLCSNYSGPLSISQKHQAPLPCQSLCLAFCFKCSFTIQISTHVPRDFPCFPSEGIFPSLLYP